MFDRQTKTKENEMEEREGKFRWNTVCSMEHYMIYEIKDAGMVEFVGDSEKDDLRTAVELFGGATLVLDAQARIVLTRTGWDIQVLAE